MSRRILVFPAGMPRSLAYLESSVESDDVIIGASSLLHDPARARYSQWCYLPYVTSPEFDDALRKTIEELSIDGVYTPNLVVWNYLSQRLAMIYPAAPLINSAPMDAELAPYRQAIKFGKDMLDAPMDLGAVGSQKPSVGILQLASLFHHAELIPGMCDHEKIRALCEIFRYSLKGDVVEIGSWWGKSAYVLSQLADYYAVGKLLCIDPWSNEHIIQNDAEGLVDSIDVNANEALTVFQMNLLPYGRGSVNYLREPSVDAAATFRKDRSVATEVFGKTNYTGKISVLHIDGNHSFDNVLADVNAWADLVISGGWIILDDYIWPYGDGPKQVGDRFILENNEKISVAFVMGSALFIQLNDRP